MSESYIDCSGLKCPEPVMRTRRALETGESVISVLVDNETARENVERFATTSGCDVQVSKALGGFLLKITRGGEVPEETARVPLTCETCSVTAVLISSERIGEGDPELGSALMKAFLYASTESESPPSTVVFMNSGVKLVTVNNETAESVRKLEVRGSEVLVCGTCLDFYRLKDQLLTGRVSNMYEIQNALLEADRTISL